MTLNTDYHTDFLNLSSDAHYQDKHKKATRVISEERCVDCESNKFKKNHSNIIKCSDRYHQESKLD